MNLRILEYFLAVAEAGNITKAAEQLLMTQPTLSRQLKQLEEELEIELFTRKNHHIELTEEGALFRRRAQEILTLTQKAKDELKNGNQLVGELVIGTQQLQVVEEISTLIAEFHTLHPEVRFRLITGSNIEIRDGLDRGELDFGILVEPTPKEMYDYVRLETKEQWGVLITQDSPFKEYKKIVQGDLVGTPVITVNDRLIQHDLISWSGATARNMKNFARYDTLLSVIHLAKKTNAPVICFKPIIKYEELNFLPLSPKLEATSICAWKSQIQSNKLVLAFKLFLQEKYK